MVQNSIVKNTQSQVTEYISNGETVRISPTMIRKYLVSGGGNVTDEEVVMFLSLCKFQHLNPFLREAYLIKYGDRQPATMVVGKDVFMKRAQKQPEFDGIEAGIILRNKETGQIEDRAGTFYDKTLEDLVGGWAKVYMKTYRVPFYISVGLNEYIGRKKDGTVNTQWTVMPATMIRKVAIAQALREAFPEQNSGGMYVQEELPQAQDITLSTEAVIVEDEAEEPKQEAVEQPAQVTGEQPVQGTQGIQQRIAGALFN